MIPLNYHRSFSIETGLYFTINCPWGFALIKKNNIFFLPVLWSKINSEPRYLFYTHLMPFLMYRDNDSGLRPSSYPYILGRALNEYRINTLVIIYIIHGGVLAQSWVMLLPGGSLCVLVYTVRWWSHLHHLTLGATHAWPKTVTTN